MTTRGRPPVGPITEVRFYDDQKAALRKAAKAKRITIAELIRRIIDEWRQEA